MSFSSVGQSLINGASSVYDKTVGSLIDVIMPHKDRNKKFC